MFKTAINHRLNAKKGCTQTVKKGCILFAFLYAYFFNLYAYFLGPVLGMSRLAIDLPRRFLFQHFVPTFANILRYHCYHSCYHLLSFRLAIVSILASSIFTSVFIATVVNRTTVSINTLVAITYVTVTTLIIFAGTAL